MRNGKTPLILITVVALVYLGVRELEGQQLAFTDILVSLIFATALIGIVRITPPPIIKPIEVTNLDEWLARRRTNVTGSDFPKIIDLMEQPPE